MTTLQHETPTDTKTPDRPAGKRAAAWFHPHVIGAVFRRDFTRFFFSPAGYVFIALFVLVCAGAAFWQPAFFTRNLDNLDTLSFWMPYLLLFFIPAVTMSVWADERKQGTDELLLTLPATDSDVVFGKYLASLGIYTVSLAFTLPLVGLLIYLGKPDLGVTFATYVGYWLTGAMLIAFGMVASQLTSNTTIAFILGALLAAVPVLCGGIAAPLPDALRHSMEDLSIPAQAHDFGTGVIPIGGVCYFLLSAAAVLYLNMLLLGRRHWAGGEESAGRWTHALIRALAVLVAVASFDVLVARAGLRPDVSQEQLNTLSADSITLLKQIPKDRPVYVQAYYSPDVPRDYVQVKDDLIGLLKECAARAGSRLRLNLVEAPLYSDAARDAETRFGITPKRVPSIEEGKQTSEEIILGVAFTSGLEEVVIPFFDRGLPVEYELTRSIRVVSRTARKKVGILNTDAKLMGGFDMKSMGQNPEWSIVTELKKQYEVSSVAPDNEIPADLDVLLVAQPSSLTQKQIDNLTAYVKRGGPALLFLDPLPIENMQIAPEVPKQSPGGPFGGGPPPEQKGDLNPLLDLLGLDWPTTEIVWNPYNPLKQNPDLPPEIVFVGKKNGAEEPFNSGEIVTEGLQEVVGLFPGLLRPKGGPGPEFTPLLTTSKKGGTVAFRDTVRQGFMGVAGFNQNRRHIPSGKSYVLAAHLKGEAAPSPSGAAKKDAAKPGKVHAIAIADLDLISEEFFQIRRQKVENLELDNVTFVLNCVDVLAGDDAFVNLRKRRLQHRTLETLEEQTSRYVEAYQNQTKDAEDKAKEELEVAQAKLNKEVEAVRARTDVDERTKEILLLNLQEVANRRLEVQKANIDDTKRRATQKSLAERENSVRSIRNNVRALAVVLPPIPPLVLGILVFFVRVRRENLGATASRLA